MKTFVICHSQELKDNAKLGDVFPNIEWVMVGNHGKFSDGIIARNLPRNIEKRPNLLAYTAWYALVKNGFITPEEFYLMSEYDVCVRNDFMDVVEPLTIPGRVIGFYKSSVADVMFLGSRIVDRMIRSIKEAYHIDVWDVVQREIDLARSLWCPSSNCIIQGKDMIAYTDWFEGLLPHYSRKPASAHYHERALRIWMALNNIEPFYVGDVFKHTPQKSHKIRFPMLGR